MLCRSGAFPSPLVLVRAPLAGPRRSGASRARDAVFFCESMPEIFCLFGPRIRARPCQGIVKLPVFSNPYRDRFGWPCVCVGCGSSPCAWGQCGPVRPHKSHCREIKGALLDPAAFSAPPRTHASCLHVCIVSACLWRACMHRTCIVAACMHASFSCLHDAFFFSMCAAFCAPPGRHASGLHACNVPACLLRACMHAGFSFDVQAVLGLSTSQHLPGSTRRSGTIGRTVTVDDRRET